ncbi:MAG: hypothetical protein NW200_07755 [Hyphomonadaceae bacterium]|nr:hypothetical protein [Hyphomonadaceae bacterium]
MIVLVQVLIAVFSALFGAQCAPVRVLRSWDLRMQRAVERMIQRGRAVLYDGEDEATVTKRLDRMAWIARDPLKAVRHLSRLHRRVLPSPQFSQACPPDFAPPWLAIAPLDVGADALIAAPDS